MLHDKTSTSVRGLSIVNDQIIWVSGNSGTIGKSENGGLSWEWFKPSGYEKLDFRSIKAFDGIHAIVVNAGSPAYVLNTFDGGKTWKQTYKNLDSAIFYDGISFWDKKNGLAFGDPINNKLQLLKTVDGGEHWVNISENLKEKTIEGEAGFAASGTGIKTLPDGKVWIASGGKASNIYYSADFGLNWKIFKCPIWQGEETTGAFSIDFLDAKNGVVVGGNYKADQDNRNNILLTKDGGKSWQQPISPVLGFRSCVIYVNKDTLIATGTSGTDLSSDGGKNWKSISKKSFNVVQKSKSARRILLAGDGGAIYELVLN
ncbi:oxidoreductase [Pedobacter changchengzhani]|uniref:Oxidoreductase n=2 Tax=Pedobacter changchengzhani TaxID=2529274 RepID=A0A4R5MNC6_9SPHI|nr:oxidoreductase [Pedobacter changchengzhani]